MHMERLSHTFAVCAYKESPYLELCIRSLLRQTLKSNIIICTSTPCKHIQDIADRYSISLYVRNGASDIREDWNYAYNMADSEWVTIAHQDDIYARTYTQYLYDDISGLEESEGVQIFLTDYRPINGDGIVKSDMNCVIRRILRLPLKNSGFAGNTTWKRRILSLGNSICCPTVTYHKGRLGESIFTSEYKYNIDWDTFLKFASENGSFIYEDRPLVLYRIHDGATSKLFIETKEREREDILMFEQFWPKIITRIIMVFYRLAYKTYY